MQSWCPDGVKIFRSQIRCTRAFIQHSWLNRGFIKNLLHHVRLKIIYFLSIINLYQHYITLLNFWSHRFFLCNEQLLWYSAGLKSLSDYSLLALALLFKFTLRFFSYVDYSFPFSFSYLKFLFCELTFIIFLL